MQNSQKLKIEAITTASLDELGNVKITRQFFTWQARLLWYKYCLKQFLIVQPTEFFEKNPAMAFVFLLSFFAPHLFPFLVIGSIAYDLTSSSATSSGTSLTFSHTTSGSNRVLILGSILIDTKNGDPTYGGVSMTQKVLEGSNRNVYVHSLIAPASGANNVVIAMNGGANTIIGIATSFSGADQTTPIDGTGSGNDSGVTSLSCNVTTSQNSTFLFDILWTFASGGAITITPNAGQTQRKVQFDGVQEQGTVSTKPVAVAGATTMGSSWSGTRNCQIATVGVRQGATAYTQTLSDTMTLTDSILKTTGRKLVETLTLTDTLTSIRLKFSTLAESLSLSDSLVRTAGKVLSETVTLSSSLVKTLGAVFSETITLTDTTIRSFGKVLTESLSLVTSLSKLLNGRVPSLWAKIAKPTGDSWSKTNKPSGDSWNKIDKPSE